MQNTGQNPWQVETIQEFSYLNCPECSFKTKGDYFFQDHALKNHPLCYVLFGSRHSADKRLIEFSEVILEKTKNHDKFPTTDYYIEVKDQNQVPSKVEISPGLIATIEEPVETQEIPQTSVS